MKRTGLLLSAAFLGLAGSVTAAAVRPGGDPACERVIWADPFDYYTQWAWDNRDNPAYPNGTTWQGGPIPAGAADSDATPERCDLRWPKLVTAALPPNCSDESWEQPQTIPSLHAMARANWVGTGCGPITTSRGVVADPGTFDVVFGGGNPRGDKCYGDGQTSTTLFMSARANYTWGTGGSYNAMNQFTFDLSDRIQQIAAARGLGTMNAINGTDANPLTLIFYIKAGSWNLNQAVYDNSFVELSLDEDTAPTDYVWRGNPVPPPKGTSDPEYCPTGPYPIVCQQAREVNSSVSEDGGDVTWLNNNCPALIPPYDAATGTGKTWRSIAFGFMAILDKDPCGQAEQGTDSHIPTADHHAVFDGNRWRQIRGGRFAGLAPGANAWPYEVNMQKGAAGASTDFVANGGDTRVYMKITTNDILLYVQSFKDVSGQAVSVEEYAAVPRVYKGGFNKIRWGVGPGCELDKTTGECKAGTGPQCLTYSAQTSSGYYRTEMDSMSLLDGVLEYVDTIHGACCNGSAGTCEVTDQQSCEADPNNRWDGVGTECGQIRCCPTPYGDTDNDLDVDMQDFAVLQQCFAGDGTINSADPRCNCLDSDQDGDIDSVDTNRFIQCASGPGVPADPDCSASWAP